MITHDRWQRIKEIFHSAQDRMPEERREFLAEACGDDHAMREEVEALLTADASNEDFLSSPAYEFAAGMLASEATEFLPGQKVGRYAILCSLGAGGMGHIYLARDAALGRKIALKLISPEFATDPRRVLRFEQEARAASALNHPNVCVIHEIGITETGRHFIAMEHIQGITLRDELARGTVKPLEALRIAVQVGAALASAHAAGIVHRDIKPENIMLRPDGYVKVVDFGLAKLTERLPEQQQPEDTATRVRTEPRILMGTVKYMSPEQLRETQVDERTDIWSLGIVLYEMLTGVTPFDARSRNDTIASILGPQPAELHLPAELPQKFYEVVSKTLEKDRSRRYQTVSRLASDLDTLKRELERNVEEVASVHGIQPPFVRHRAATHRREPHKGQFGSAIFTRLKSQALSTAAGIRSHKTAALFTSVTGVLVLLFLIQSAPSLQAWINKRLGLIAVPQQVPTPKQAPTPDLSKRMVRFTTDGTSVCAALSFDGKWVAHAEEESGKQRVLITSTATSGASLVVAPEKVKYIGLSFSRDSNYLYYVRSENNGPGVLYRLALPGGAPIKIKADVDSPISFSPQEDRFAFVRQNRETSEFYLMMATVDGVSEQAIATRSNGNTLSMYGLAWSPDGSVIVCPSSYWDKGFKTSLVAFDLKNGREQVIGAPWFSIFQVAWQQDMSSLVISAREGATVTHQIWRISYPDGGVTKLTYDVADYHGVSLSGTDIVTVRTDWSWRIGVSSLHGLNKGKMIEGGIGLSYGLTWTRNGQIVYSKMSQGKLNLWRVDPDTSTSVQLTSEAGDNYNPAACPNSGSIVFSSNRNGANNIWRMNEDGSDLKQITDSDANFYPSCSPDNQWVAYDSMLDWKLTVWKVPMEGGERVKLAENYRMPVFSPDGQYIACRYDHDSGTYDVAIYSANGGPPLQRIPIPNLDWQRIQWLPRRRALSFIKSVDGHANIWSYDLDTGKVKQLTRFDSDRIFAYAWSPDYKQIACEHGSRISDVVMISEQ